MPGGADARRGPARPLVLVLGILTMAALGVAILGMRSFAAGASPEELSNGQLLTRMAQAPERAPQFSAAVTVEQNLLPTQFLNSMGSEGPSPVAGPQTARVWYGGEDRTRAELQGENGDKVFVTNGQRVSFYDGATNTLRTGSQPDGPESIQDESVNPADVNELLDELGKTSNLEQGDPIPFGGRQAYVLTLTPKDAASTLFARGRALVDSETYLPLELSLYAEGSAEPVFSWSVSGFDVGPIPDERFEFSTPPGANVEPLDPGQKKPDLQRRKESEGPAEVADVAQAQEAVDFEVGQLQESTIGRELTGVYLTGSGGVVLTYGSGWGTVVLTQEPGEAGQAALPDGVAEDLQLPSVDVGGAEAQELSTPVGTVLRWGADGVSFTLAGSVPPPELERAARGLR